MAVERRGCVRLFTLRFNSKEEDVLSGTKPFAISKDLVKQAFQLVKENRGAAGVDKQTPSRL